MKMTRVHARSGILAVLLAAACGGPQGGADEDAAAGGTPPAGEALPPRTVTVEGITVTGAWARPAILMEGDTVPVNTAAYMTLTADSTDRLVAGSVALAGMVEIHESLREDGVMRMRPANPADLQFGPEEPLVLRPGGLHVMIMNVKETLPMGSTLDLTLEFESGKRVTLTAPVRNTPPE